jgi:2OG-Fe(II) oxygenase superfamily
LKAVCSKAPFGRGTETLYDETVRRAQQIDASQITLGGEEWDKHLQLVVDKACYEMGFSSERIRNLNVHANLYKLLLYETGGHFTPHRDIEKENGMFGTLVVQLPCRFTGGALTVKHNSESKTFELSDKCEDTMKYIAFYADCEHQLHPITSGVRLCLVFNLVAVPPKMDVSTMSSLPTSHSNNLMTEKASSHCP